MRIKLIVENFLHNKFISILIVLCSLIVTILALLSIEMNNYLVFANIEKQKYNYNDFDIVINANIPLSTVGTQFYTDNEAEVKLDKYYDRVISYYSTTLVVSNSDINDIVNIIETDKIDYENGFDLDIIPKNNEAVLTKETAESLNVGINDNITINLKNEKFTYKIINIIEGNRLYTGKYILIGGRNITYQYGLNNVKFHNNILVDLNDKSDIEFIHHCLKENYSFCNVRNLLDEEEASKININTMPAVCMIVCIVFLILLFILFIIYSYRMTNQRIIFENFKMLKYLNQLHFIELIILLIINMIFGGFITNLILYFFNPIFNCSKVFVTSFISIILSSSLILIIPLLFFIIKNTKQISLKLKNLINLCLLVLCFILHFVISNDNYKNVFFILIFVFSTILIINLVTELTKYLKSFFVRFSLYNLNKNNRFFRLFILVQIAIMISFGIIVCTISTYNYSIKTFDEFLTIDNIVLTTSKANQKTEYDHIKIANDVDFGQNNVQYLICLNAEQLESYTSIDLNNNEKAMYENDKAIILPSHYRNTYDLNVNEKVSLNINGNNEEFKVIKFIDGLTAPTIFVSKSDFMYDAYVVDDEVECINVINDFKNTTYSIVNVRNTINNLKSLHVRLLELGIVVMIGIMILLIVFSLYFFYLEFIYQKDKYAKLKTLGVNNSIWIKLTIVKVCFLISLCVIFGSIIEYIVITRLDSVLGIFSTTLQIDFSMFNLLLSIMIIVINALLGIIYNILEYKKLNKL